MKILMVFLCLLFTGGLAMAQAPSHLKGPAAKNYKHWQDKTKAPSESTLVAYEQKSRLTGPAAKNRRLLKDRSNLQVVEVRTNNQIKDLIGPEYKNRTFWERVQTDRADVADEKPVKRKEKTNSDVGGGE